nr:MAG TPA: ParB protein [Caudoviricetes sp.]
MKIMAKFDLKGLLNDRSVPDRQQDQKIVYRNPEDLIPSEDNFYNTEKLEMLKQSIELLGILQPLLIENRDGKDYVIAGHCRRKCCIDLIQEGNDKFSRIPCIYKSSSELEQDASQGDEIVRQIMLIQANVYREKTDWEKMTEVLTMENLLTELRKKVLMQGRSRKILKDISKTSAGQLGRYHTISRHLCEQLMAEFKEDRIKISVAYEAARLSEEYQKQACEMYAETGVLTLSDIEGLYRQQEAEKGIPGQMTIETATGQNRPPEDDTEIPAETQIERFYESTNKNMKNYIIQEDKNMTIFMLSNLYGSARVRNGHLNYQGSTAGITFNPGGVFEHELSWQSLAKILIGKYGHKKPVKMVPVDTPDNAEYTISEAVKAFCEAYPEKLKTIMRICRLYNNNGDAARAAQKRIAPYGYHGCTGPEVGYTFMGFNAGLEIEIGKEKVSMKYGRLIAEVKKLYDPWDSKFDEEERCQSVAETPDEKQHDFVEDTKIADHFGDTTDMPDAWPQDLKDIPIPTEIEITGYLYDEERKLREILEVEKEEPGMPRMEIMRQQMITAGLRLIKNLVKDCREE